VKVAGGKVNTVELGAVAEFINGAAFKPEDWSDDGKRIIRIQNLNDSEKAYNRTSRPVSEKLHVQPGDILVSWSASLGVFIWSGPDVAVLNQHIFRVVPDFEIIDKSYLRHQLIGALADMQQHLHGATMLHVNRGDFLATKIPLPPLPEQRRIAQILEKGVSREVRGSPGNCRVQIQPT
jgi:type I restriction enzyme S subunit